MQGVATTAIILATVSAIMMCAGFLLEGDAADYECELQSYLDDHYANHNYSKYDSPYEQCYSEKEEIYETSALIYGIGFSLTWFSLILAIASNRLE